MHAPSAAPGAPAAVVHLLDSPLAALIGSYHANIDALGTASPSEIPSLLVETFRTRDEIASILSVDSAANAREIVELSRVDAGLRGVAARVERAVGVSALGRLRASTAGPHQGWWWNMEEYLPRQPLVWSALAAILLTAAVGVVAEIARRFFSEGPDFVGAVYILIQAGLALFAGTTLVTTGGGVLQHWLDDHHVRRSIHARLRALAAFAILALAIGAYLLLPAIARRYNAAGVARADEGSKSRAIQDFRRALSLSPDFSEAHYNLGRAYEAVVEYDSALSEYQKAIEIERGMYLASNSLARLYIVRKNDPASALRLIDEALELTGRERATQSPEEMEQVRLALYKNRGWANLKAGNLAQARLDLAEGLAIDANRASLHCLLAQVDEKDGMKNSSEWDLCLGYSNGATDVESDWFATAQDRSAAREVVK